MNRVFVVQRPAYFCRERKGWVNKYDLSPAEKHGKLIFLLRPGNIYKDKMQGAIENLQELLADYTENDCLLAIGDPVAISAAVLVAASKTGGSIKMLKFDRIEAQYDCYEVSVPL